MALDEAMERWVVTGFDERREILGDARLAVAFAGFKRGDLIGTFNAFREAYRRWHFEEADVR